MKAAPKTFYVTTPIYYPSGNLHIGHVYTTSMAWALRNYKRLRGFDAKMLTGADEHGLKIEREAQLKHLTPQEYVNAQNAKFENLWTKYGIDFDFYSRTTSGSHISGVQTQFSELLKNHAIVLGEYEGWYSVSDEEFLTPSQAIEKNGHYYHPVSGHELTRIAEPSYMFEMQKYEKWLKKYFAANPDLIVPHKVVNELQNNFLSKGLENLSVSRSTFKWGIPVRENPHHIVYVWLDALNNYITALGYNTGSDQNFQKYWVNGTEIVHIVGKEIARFHAIYWPIILHAASLRLPTKILAHGWIITPEGKMSKSKGNVVDPLTLLENYHPEVIKYFLLSQITIENDGVFSHELLQRVYNADLVNNFSNLVARAHAMINQNFKHPVRYRAAQNEVDKELEMAVIEQTSAYITAFEAYDIAEGIKCALRLSSLLNKYIDETTPWKLTTDKPRLEQVLNRLLNGIYAVGTMLSVVMPQKTTEILHALGQTKFSFDDIKKFEKFDHITIKPMSILFARKNH